MISLYFLCCDKGCVIHEKLFFFKVSYQNKLFCYNLWDTILCCTRSNKTVHDYLCFGQEINSSTAGRIKKGYYKQY